MAQLSLFATGPSNVSNTPGTIAPLGMTPKVVQMKRSFVTYTDIAASYSSYFYGAKPLFVIPKNARIIGGFLYTVTPSNAGTTGVLSIGYAFSNAAAIGTPSGGFTNTGFLNALNVNSGTYATPGLYVPPFTFGGYQSQTDTAGVTAFVDQAQAQYLLTSPTAFVPNPQWGDIIVTGLFAGTGTAASAGAWTVTLLYVTGEKGEF
jgi:hypothetical protein